MRLNKTLGQHFLTNPKINELIAKTAQIKAGDVVVEIGPGTGLLTDYLLEAGARVIAVEKSREFVARLREKYRGQNIEIIEDDVLNWKIENSLKIENLKFKIIGNIPYYLTSHLFRVVLQEWPRPELIVFMIQKEVARRMIAKPPHMNMLAVLVQCYATPEIVKIVKAGNFTPAPKVDSAIIKLTPRGLASWSSSASRSILELAARGFKHPRKKLSNNLPEEMLERAGIDPNRRAETLSLDEWKNCLLENAQN